MSRSARDALTARFTSLKLEGLVDVKFLLRNLDNATEAAVFSEVEEMLRMHQEGLTHPFTFGDGTVN
ncbi:MAG: hypothetical protein ABF689_12220 [Gluconobacter cerinus]|uniref:hypothetical protein n=1 Tax=Gluconobacter cerinus TaxID=38307 RepID=UPI0039EAB3E1